MVPPAIALKPVFDQDFVSLYNAQQHENLRYRRAQSAGSAWHCEPADCGLTFSPMSVVVGPHLQAMNGRANVHGQIDGSDRLLVLKIVQANG